MTGSTSTTFIDPAIFEHLQNKIDEESKVRDELKDIVQKLEKEDRILQSILSHTHSTPRAQFGEAILAHSQETAYRQRELVQELSRVASQHPFYKWNNIWQREIQNLIFQWLFLSWLQNGELETIELVGKKLDVPVNLKDRDAFHITIEDYLLAVCSLIEELARLSTNSVTLSDFSTPLLISKFIKDVHAGFQLLNLKNDILRRRADGIKYSVKKVEDVVYDLSLRGLTPKKETPPKEPKET